MWNQDQPAMVLDFSVTHRIVSLADDFGQKSVEQMFPVVASLTRGERSVRHPICSFSGFYSPDCGANGTAAWTNGDGIIECCFPQPTKMRYVWIEVAATGPTGTKLGVYVDGKRLMGRQKVRGRRAIRVWLGKKRVTNAITVRLESSSYIPAADCPGETDNRVLGIAVRRIVFGAKKSAYQPHSDFDRSFSQIWAKTYSKLRRKWAA